MNKKISSRFIWVLGLFFFFAAAGCAEAGVSLASEQATFTPVVVRILNLDQVNLPASPAPASTSSATPTIIAVLPPTQTPPANISDSSPGKSSATPSCSNKAEFISNLSISDNTMLLAGQSFAKIWLIKNAGTCTWTDVYRLRFFSGDKMSGPDQVELPYPVNPGETVEIRLNLVAPSGATTSSGNWVMSDPEGNLFGFGVDGAQPVSVVIQIKPTPKPTSG